MTVISRAPKKAFIQASKYEGSWGHPFLSDSCKAAAVALKALGYDVRTFTPNNFPAKNKVTPHTPVKGDTGCVKFLYERTFGVEYPNFDVPRELEPFARRKITYPTLGKINSVFTCGNLDEVKPNTPLPGRILATGWKSYARYAEQGRF